jgi:hypothetical protein
MDAGVRRTECVVKPMERKGPTLMRRSLLPLAALAAVLAAGTQARAGLITWGYNWDRSPVSVAAGSGGVSFTNEPPNTATGNSDIVATNLQVFSSATVGNPDKFGPSDGHYALTITLSDLHGHTGSLTFTGQLQGMFAHDFAGITNHFTVLTKSITLGNDLFTVSMIAYSPPGPPSQHNLGSITSHVDVAPAISGGGGTPEPASLLLGGIGLTFFGGAAWRARRRKAAAAA